MIYYDYDYDYTKFIDYDCHYTKILCMILEFTYNMYIYVYVSD